MRKIILLFLFLLVQTFLSAQTITGRLIDQFDNGLSGFQLQLYTGAYVYDTFSGSDGNFIFNNVTVEVENAQIPTNYSVSDNFPNPFNPKTRLAITLPNNSIVRVNVFNLLGQKVIDQIEQQFNAGTSFLDLELAGLSNGFYIARIELNDKYIFTKKLMLLYGSQHLSNSTGSISFGKTLEITKPTLELALDSLVITGSFINRTVYTNLPPITSGSLDLGDFLITLPVTYEGSGIVGPDGAIVRVTTESSPIKGAYIFIPQDALTSNVNIAILQAPPNLKYQEDSTALLIQLEPEGLEFNKAVQIGIPYNSSVANINELKAFYFNPDSNLLKQLHIVSKDTSNKVVSVTSNHFSEFLADDDGVIGNIIMYYDGNIIVNVYVDGYIGGTNYGLSGIPVLWPFISFPIVTNAKQFIDNWTFFIGDRDPNLLLQVKLKKKVNYWFDDVIETKTLDFFRIRESNGDLGGELYIDHNNAQFLNPDLELLYYIPNQNSEERELWFSGDPLCFYFDTPPESDAEYYVEVKWVITGGPQFSEISVTKIYSFDNYNSSKNISMMIQSDPDQDNNYIIDYYQAPILTSTSVTEITVNSATSGGNITSQGNSPIIERGVCWSTSQNPTINDSKTVNGSGMGNFTSLITGLSQATQYFVRAYATNNNDTGYGNQISFTTVEGGITGQPCPGIATITDERTGKVYNTVLIGDQCWLDENMNIGIQVDGITEQTYNNLIEKYCYDNLEENCSIYGGLYQWNEAMMYSTNEIAQGICPRGWHLPSYGELQTLKLTVGGDGNSLKDLGQGIGEGAGTNISGFSALLAGGRGYGNFLSLSTYALLWSSTKQTSPSGTSINLLLEDINSNVGFNGTPDGYGMSVRCIKDIWTSCPGEPTINYANKTYNTVQIGNQCWLKENLDVGIMINGGVDQISGNGIEKYCYENNPTNCESFGGLYQWKEAIQYSEEQNNVQGICPNGWYIPTEADFNELILTVNDDGNSLKRENVGIGDGIGTNISGFSALLTGYMESTGNSFEKNVSTQFWRTGYFNYDSPVIKLVFNNSDIYSYSYHRTPKSGYSVRCIKKDILPITPTVTTSSITNFTSNSAISGGNVTDQGSSSVTVRGVCWSHTQNPTTSNDHSSDGIGGGSFISSIFGLSPSTLYYVRAYATNSAGTSYGNQVSFTTSSSGGGTPCSGITIVPYAGKVYNTIEIGEQCWLKENLNVGIRINGAQDQLNNSPSNVIEKYCYNDLESNCDTSGGLYQWDEAMMYATSAGAQGICPAGWHIPSYGEFVELYTFNNGTASGFYALMAGYRNSIGAFNNLGNETYFWSSTESTNFDAKRMHVLNDSSIELGLSTIKVYGFSVRCIKD